MATPTFTATGTKSTTVVTLPKDVFALKVDNHETIKQAYVAHQANGRINLAKTLKRGEVSGGGKKPWRQKGTGNARTGSIRNPIWRGGGITFGPQGNENYTKKVNVKANKQALKQSLSLAAKDGRIAVIEDFTVKSGKTSDLAKLLSKLGLGSRVTIVTVSLDDKTLKAAANIKDVDIMLVSNLSVAAVLDAKNLLITKEAITKLQERLVGKQ